MAKPYTKPRYRTMLRPAGFGGLPQGVKWQYVEWPNNMAMALPNNAVVSRYRYGVIETNRELTPEELEHFDIAPVYMEE